MPFPLHSTFSNSVVDSKGGGGVGGLLSWCLYARQSDTVPFQWRKHDAVH